MLNEEEIINRLKERIKIDRSMRLNVESDFDRFCEEECIAIEELIDLYNKEKEKNKELKVLIEQNLKYSHNLEKDLFENCSNYVISKDKIKEKIKEYDGLKEMDMQAYEEQIKPLQDLLEEE